MWSARMVVVLLFLNEPAWAGLWEDVARRGRFGGDSGTRDIGKRAGDDAATESRLRAVLQAAPDDFQARRALAALFSASGRARDAAREYEIAVRVAPTPAEEARIWFRLATERSRMGAYDDALDAYERQLALGDTEPAALSNSAELLMAKGTDRLRAAIDRYREAIHIEEREPNRREHIQGLSLGYFGLAVALDRDGQALASQEAIARALALDPGIAALRLGAPMGSALFFVPPGDVFYYLGLARQAQGRGDDAAAAFRDYLRVTTGPYTPRAREHLAQLARLTVNGPVRRPSGSAAQGTAGRQRTPGAPVDLSPGDQAPGTRLRILHQATLVADGPLVAPLIDAAWRMDRRLLDSCLREVPLPPRHQPAAPQADDAPAGGSATPAGVDTRQFKLSLELRIEDSGRVSAVTVSAPAALGNTISRCIETEVLTRFRVSRPSTRKPTRARMELVLAPAAPGGV